MGNHPGLPGSPFTTSYAGHGDRRDVSILPRPPTPPIGKDRLFAPVQRACRKEEPSEETSRRRRPANVVLKRTGTSLRLCSALLTNPAEPRPRRGAGVLAGDESDGRVRRGEPLADSPSRRQGARLRGAGGGGEPPQLRLEGGARRARADRPPQGRHAGRCRGARRHPGDDGRPGVPGERVWETPPRCAPPRTARGGG